MKNIYQKNISFFTRYCAIVLICLSALFHVRGAQAQTVTYSTEPIVAANVLQGTTNHVTYILKVVVGAGSGVTYNNIQVNTAGTYVATDIDFFNISINTTPSATGATVIGNDFSSGVAGEILDFGVGSRTLAASSTTYFIVRADITAGAAAGNTFKINGATNALAFNFTGPAPTVTNGQTDIAGLQTIFRPTVTYSTEAVAAANVLQGTTNQVVYILKVVAGADAGMTYNTIQVNTAGTYVAADIDFFNISINTIPSASGATVIGNDFSSGAAGETLDFGVGSRTFAAGSTTYFIVRANVTAAAAAGNTFKINGATNALAFNYVNTTPAVTNSQTDIAGLQTIFRPTVTYSTEAVGAANVLQGTTNQVVYILKVVAGADAGMTYNTIQVNTAGTYVAADIDFFNISINTIPSAAGATVIGNDFSSGAAGETLDFGVGSRTFAAGSTTYFIVRANVTAAAAAGNTFKIDGATNLLAFNYVNTTPAVTNSQTDIAGLQTIFRPTVTYSTETVPAANVLQGTANQVVYILKVVAGADAGMTYNTIQVNTAGTYVAADIDFFNISINTIPSASGATVIGNDFSSDAAGETLDFGVGSRTFAAGSTTYFIVRANVTAGATVGNTFKIDGATNLLAFNYVNTTPAVTNNQTNIAGLQTIFGPTVTYSTETVPAANVLQGTTNQVVYILKVVAGADAGMTYNTIQVNTAGTYAAADIDFFNISINTIPSASGATVIGNDFSSGAAGETLDFGVGSRTFAAGSTTYFIVRANVTAAAAAGNTFKINGATNALAFNYVNTTPAVTNNQTDIAGLQTIFRPTVTYSTETVPAANVLQGTANQVVYILKVVAGVDAGMTYNTIQVNTAGTYVATDIESFNILINTTPSVSGATVIGNDFSSGVAGETLDFGVGSRTFAAGSTTYFIVRANVTAGATAGNTFKINGATNALAFNYVNTTPAVTNSQTDVAGLQTIGQPSLTYSTEIVSAANVVQGTNNQVFHIMKIVNGPVNATFNSVQVITSGTYSAGDITGFNLMLHTSPTAAGATVIANDFSSTGSGETIDFGTGSRTLAANTTYYLIFRASVSPSSAAGNTFKINGATNPTSLNFVGTSPAITNNQADNSGLQTIFGPVVTYSTEALSAGIVPKGTNNHPFYILKVVLGPDAGATFTNLNVVTSGTYVATDITAYSLYRNATPSFTGGTSIGNDFSVTGSGETITFSTGNVNLAAGSTTYFIVRANVAVGAVTTNTFFVNGQLNPATLSFSGSSPAITNNQTNVAGAQSIEQQLPVHLVNFSVKHEGSARTLKWETAMEVDNAFFELQRSLTGREFDKIAHLDGAGTTNFSRKYSYVDADQFPTGTMLYYRLRQVDTDGSEELSRIISARVTSGSPEVSVFPNPFAEHLSIRFNAGEKITLSLYTADGTVIRTPKQVVVPVTGEVSVKDLAALKSGIYLLKVDHSSGQVMHKVVRH